MSVTSDHNDDDIMEYWDYPVNLNRNKTLYKLLQVIAAENKRLDLDIEEIYDNKFLDTATGAELGKIGKIVGAQRKTGEGDAKFRKRIRAEFAAQASDTTFENVASATLSILEASPGQITINTPPDTTAKVIQIEVDGGVIDDNPLSISELGDLLDRTVSVDARVDLIEIGTFAFAGDDDTLKGWDEGTWSSTVS